MHNTHVYGDKAEDFTVGQRVAFHPASGMFMRGRRYGTVTKVGRVRVMVQPDSFPKPVAFSPSYLAFMAED